MIYSGQQLNLFKFSEGITSKEDVNKHDDHDGDDKRVCYHHYPCIDRRIYFHLCKSTQSAAGLEVFEAHCQ